MALRRLQVSDFRCMQSAVLEFDTRLTLINGLNASGKTSLLEAIFVLGRGRSFRTRRLVNLVRSNTSRFIVFGEADVGQRSVSLGVEGSTEGIRARMAGQRVTSLTELAAALPVQIIDPEVHRLIEEGPQCRRRFVDWGVFHVEPGFISDWQKYQLTLKQRNAALKASQPARLVCAWDGELVRLGISIDDARSRYVEHLGSVARVTARALLDLDLDLTYRSGWTRDLSFEAALKESSRRDRELGTTTMGPHRAELSIRLGGHAVKDRISRGQQKLLAAALLIAQVRSFPQMLNKRPTLLLDDPAAELDSDHLIRLIREVGQETAQLVVTSLNPALKSFGVPGRRYRIVAGAVGEE